MTKLKLEWTDEQNELPISEALIGKLEQLLQLAGEREGFEEGEVSLSFVDDERIRELNLAYRGLDKPTDVLSFAIMERGEDELDIIYDDEYEEDYVLVEGEEDDETDGEDEVDIAFVFEPLGDIVISVPTALRQADEYGHSVERELGFLFVHGFLHLIGYDHETEEQEKEMFAKQERILAEAGLTR